VTVGCTVPENPGSSNSAAPVVTVATLAAGGAGIGRLENGRVVFIPDALPGESVEIELTEQRKDFARAAVISWRRRSPARIEPPCPEVAKGCGGCGWQHVDPFAAAHLKTEIVLDALRRIGHVRSDIETLAPLACDPDGYRTTARVGVLDDGSLGYHRHRSTRLVRVGGCAVTHPRLDGLLDAVRVTGASSVTLRVGVAGGERLVILPGAPPARKGSNAGTPAKGKAAKGKRAAKGKVALKVEAPDDVVVVATNRDRACLHEMVGGRTWQVSARSFFQSGPGPAGVLVGAVDAAVGDALARGDRLVDAYAGVGLLGGVLAARRGAALVAVESSRVAAADARVNLVDLDAEVIAGEVGRWRATPADVVIADPARPGLGRPGVAALVGSGAARLVLVSCDPASLGRDAALLAAQGYSPSTVQVADLFPRTPHIEVVTRFDRT
jgi:23S rRNA (uracil1939-C5)-methyltransferase